MIDLSKLQQQIYENKVNKGFNISNIEKEFCFLQGELSEAYQAYLKKLPDLDEELADIMIYLLGLSEILKIDLEKAVLQKMEKNEKRQYVKKNGVLLKKE